MIPFKITKRHDSFKIIAIGIAKNYNDAVDIAKRAGHPITDYGISIMARDAYNAIKDRGKISIITARDELPEGPRLDLIIDKLKKVRKDLKKLRGEGGCSVEELTECYEQIGAVLRESMPGHPIIDINASKIDEARALFNKLVWTPPDQRRLIDTERLYVLISLIRAYELEDDSPDEE